MNEIERRVASTFYPFMIDRIDQIGDDGRFVHYSSAEAAVGILTNKEVWLRNTTCMNDYMEVEHGLEALAEAYKSPIGLRMQEFLNSRFDGVCVEVANLFDQHQNGLRDNSYLVCVSEHQNSEDTTGRLSMWRAYGQGSGVALVLKAAPFRSQSNVLKAYSSSVRYVDRANLPADFQRLVAGMEANELLLQSIGRDAVKAHLFNMFKWAALSIKHPGFREELEWRVVYTPTLEKSDVLEQDVKTIRGVPQTIYKLPLRTFEGEDFSTAIPDLIDRIILGPTEYPLAMRDAFVELLRRAGVADPSARVWVSDIPLRAVG